MKDCLITEISRWVLWICKHHHEIFRPIKGHFLTAHNFIFYSETRPIRHGIPLCPCRMRLQVSRQEQNSFFDKWVAVSGRHHKRRKMLHLRFRDVLVTQVNHLDSQKLYIFVCLMWGQRAC